MSDLRALGWTRAAVRNALSRGALMSVGPRSYARVQPLTFELRIRAAAMRYPRGVSCHRSALLWYGLPLVGTAPPAPDLTVGPRSNANLADVHVHRAGLRRCDVATYQGLLVTSVARTLVDVARSRPVATSVAAIDAALREDMVTIDEFEDCLRYCWNWPGIRRAQRAIGLCDRRAESPLESVSRLVFSWLQLPPPELQRQVFDAYGPLVARPDFYWDEYGVFGEADGRLKYADGGRDALLREKERHEALEDLGLTGVRWGWADVTRRRYALRTRVLNAFERGAARDRSGFPRKWLL
jgi:hypothetical protein